VALRGAAGRQGPRGKQGYLYDNLDEVVKLAARNRLMTVEYERPSLEEVFLTYYGAHQNGGRHDVKR
jgi:hypothetical protein